ncbi:MAG: arylamine N-acetyltransferase [Rhizobiaceae bacterium]|nr:arylamine N-acetyltransferase [Rhizobiaceae bacterium]
MVPLMTDFQFDQQAYLRRIGIEDSGQVEVNLDSLRRLLRHQIYAIPFENFDICLGRTIDLDPNHQFDKLVRHRRGGYCFEVNGLMLNALQSFGFEARPLLARVHGEDFIGGRDHQLTLVSLDHQQWIVDAGFGRDTPHCPLPLQLDKPISCNKQNLKFADGAHLGTLMQVENAGRWTTLYSFDDTYAGPADIKYSNHYTSTHPDSHFVQRRVAALPIEGGVVTLSDQKLTIRKNGEQTEIHLPDNQQYLQLLEQHLGIDLQVDYSQLKPLVED